MLALYALPLIVALFQPAPASSQLPQAPPTPPPLVSPAPQTSSTAPPLGSPAPQTTPAAPATGASPGPSSSPSLAPTAVPAAAPTPLLIPAPSGSPTPAPSPTPSPAASATPLPYAFIVNPSPGPVSGPQIVQVALNDHVLHKGGPLLVRITTTVDVTSVVASTMGHQIAIQKTAPGVFSGGQQLPDGIPFFLLGRNYDVDFIATTADGRSARTTLSIRLER